MSGFKVGPSGYSVIGALGNGRHDIERLEGNAKLIYYRNILNGKQQLDEISQEDQQEFVNLISEIRNRNDPSSLSSLFYIAVSAIGDNITWPLEIMMDVNIFGTTEKERKNNSQNEDGNTLLHLITIDGSNYPVFGRDLMERFTGMVVELFGAEVLTAMNKNSQTALDIATNPKLLLKNPNDLEEIRENNTSPRNALVDAIKNAYKRAGYPEAAIFGNVR